MVSRLGNPNSKESMNKQQGICQESNKENVTFSALMSSNFWKKKNSSFLVEPLGDGERWTVDERSLLTSYYNKSNVAYGLYRS